MACEYNEEKELSEKYDIKLYNNEQNNSKYITGLNPDEDLNDIFDIPEDYNEKDYDDYDEEKELSEKYKV